jgi:lysozyme
MAASNPQKIGIAIALATAIAIPAEGLRRAAYRDPVGILTVCYGTTGPEVVAGKVYSLEQCKSMLQADMREAVETVDKCAPGAPEKVLAAFADAVYNIGPRIACDKAASTAARKLAAKDWVGACNELPKWDKARVADRFVALPGLTKRRAAERALCLQGAQGTRRVL